MSDTRGELPDLFDEEPWERDIAALLADLPDVEPPPGFIEAAIDHRPLHAGRAALAVIGVSSLAVASIGALGMIGPERIAPSPSLLSSHHRSVESATAAAGRSLSLGEDPVLAEALRSDAGANVEVVPPGPEPLDLPTEYEHQGDLVVDDLRQAVYAHGDETVSVFAQVGRADFDALGRDHVERFGPVEGWVDEAEQVLIVEAGDHVVTIVGLEPAEMAEVLEDARPAKTSRWRVLAKELTAQLGFAS